MEYQKKKFQILEKVQYTNLLSFSLVQNKLERNFRSIVDALMLNQARTQQLAQSHLTLSESHAKQTSQIKGQMQEIMKQLQNLKNQQKNNLKSQPSSKFLSQHELQKMPSRHVLQKKQLSQHNLSQKQINDTINKQMKQLQNRWQNDKRDLMSQIKDLKDKLGMVDSLKDDFNNLKVDMKMMQDDVVSAIKSNNNNKANSSKNMIKRESILNMVANKNTQKNIQKSKPQLLTKQQSRKQLSQGSKLSIKGQISQQNKQNNPTLLSQQNLQQQQIFNQNLDKQINSIYMQLNTLKISFEQLKDMLSDNKKQTYKNNNALAEIKDDLGREIKTRKTQNQGIQKAIKEIKMQMLNLSTNEISNSKNSEQDKNLRQTSKSTKPKKQQQDNNVNYKNQLNDKMSRMQAMIQNFITQTQFNRFKNDVNDQLEKILSKLDNNDLAMESIDKKYENLIAQINLTTNDQFNQIRTSMQALGQSLKNQAHQNQRKHNILQARIQQLKKSLQNLRQDLQFYQSIMNDNNNANKLNKNSSDQNLNSPLLGGKQKSSNLDQKSLENLKSYFTGKMHDLRTNLLGLIRDLQKKLNNKSNGEQEIIKIWDKLNQISLFMNKKADQDDTKKTYLYLEKKINRLNGLLFKNEDNTEDARIARTNNWYCLSCDKNLNTYQGKLGKHVVWDQMPLKGINKSVAVTQQNDNKKSLPQLKK